jgi:hypothetical protein
LARDPLPAVVAFASTYTDSKPQLSPMCSHLSNVKK